MSHPSTNYFGQFSQSSTQFNQKLKSNLEWDSNCRFLIFEATHVPALPPPFLKLFAAQLQYRRSKASPFPNYFLNFVEAGNVEILRSSLPLNFFRISVSADFTQIVTFRVQTVSSISRKVTKSFILQTIPPKRAKIFTGTDCSHARFTPCVLYYGQTAFCNIMLLFKKKKMGQLRPLFRLFSVFSNKQYNFYNKYM